MRISCFVVGEVHPAANAFTALFMQDPLFVYRAYPIPVDLPDGEKQKLDRVYFPRTRARLENEFEAIVFRDARIQHFTSRQFSDLDHAFREAGMASVTAHGPSWEHAWSISILCDLSPVDNFQIRFYRPWRVSFRTERDPVFTPFVELGMERVVGDAYGTMEAKEGATIWADMVPQGVPWLVSWRSAGKKGGMQWVIADKFDASWWGLTYGARDSNPYSLDLATNLLLYSVGRPLIVDIHARREARQVLASFQAQKLLLLSLLEWAERFGANTMALGNRLNQLDSESTTAVGSYLEQDYAGTIGFMDSVASAIEEVSLEAVRLKDGAMFWVYLTEWLAVTGVSLMGGFVVWSLMVRRRAFKEVGETRLRPIY